MNYQYYNHFYLSRDLANAISYIISQKEGTDYVCRTLEITIPERKGLVFSSLLDGCNSWSGGHNAFSGAQINTVNVKYGIYVEGGIETEDHMYLVVMDRESFQKVSSCSFKSAYQIKNTLDVLSAFCFEYEDGFAFDSRTLCVKFPYLQDFFDRLDEWRSLNGRVTVDENILVESINETLACIKQKSR